MREIGSEFWLANHGNDINYSLEDILQFGDDKQYLFSGRTAIDFVLEDISKPINKVYMPSYCCDSMLQPFVDNEIIIEFYDVIIDEEGLRYVIDFEKEVDIFFATSYFGFHNTTMETAIEIFKNKNCTVIEDITHRLLSEQNYCMKADYFIASLRKWFAIPTGGLAIKYNGKFNNNNLKVANDELVDKKIKAMKMKAKYMRDLDNNFTEIEKGKFLSLFSEFNTLLTSSYKNVDIDNFSKQLLSNIDIKYVKEKRRSNTKYLYESIKESEQIKFLIRKPNLNEDCPLYVPILVASSVRGLLKEHLISKNIYCPIHWPVPKIYSPTEKTISLYKEEVSLICDQRYGRNDIKKIAKTIEEFKVDYD